MNDPAPEGGSLRRWFATHKGDLAAVGLPPAVLTACSLASEVRLPPLPEWELPGQFVLSVVPTLCGAGVAYKWPSRAGKNSRQAAAFVAAAAVGIAGCVWYIYTTNRPPTLGNAWIYDFQCVLLYALAYAALSYFFARVGLALKGVGGREKGGAAKKGEAKKPSGRPKREGGA